MNPLISNHEKNDKQQQPIIAAADLPDYDGQPIRKRPFSNCVLFVLLAVFVFALACFAVFTAIAMGVPAEKSQVTSGKPEALNRNELIALDEKSERTQEDIIDNEKNFFPDFLNLNPRFRIRIFIKGNGDTDSNKEFLKPEENKTDDALNSIPKARFTFSKIIFHDTDSDKSDLESSEETTVGSDEGVKKVTKVSPFEKLDLTNPLDTLLNIFKLPFIKESPIGQEFKKYSYETSQNENPKIIKFEQQEKVPLIGSPEELFQDLSSIEKPKNVEQPEKMSLLNRNPFIIKFEKKERIPLEDDRMPFDPMASIVKTVHNLISDLEQKDRSDENGRQKIQLIPGPSFVHFYKFGNPHNQHLGNMGMFPPMYNRISFNDRHPFVLNNMMTSPFNSLSGEDKSSSSEENSKMVDISKSTPSTATISPPKDSNDASPELKKNSISHIPASRPGDEENEIPDEHYEKTAFPYKVSINKVKPISNKLEEPKMIDRIDTENVEPFEKAIKSILRA